MKSPAFAPLGMAVAVSLVFLSACSTGSDLPVRRAAPANSIFVSRGDTVQTLAQQYGVPERDLIAQNNLAPPYVLQPGQRLSLPKPRTYTVQAGDTVYGVARRYNIDMAELVRLNQIPAPYVIRVGQELRLPGDSRGPANTQVATASRPAPAPATAPSYRPMDPPPAASPRPSVEAAPLEPPRPGPATPAPVAVAPSAPARQGIVAEALAPPPSGSNPPAHRPAPLSPAPSVTTAPTASTPVSPAPIAPAPVAPAPQSAPPVQQQVATSIPPAPSTPPAATAPRDGARFVWPVRGKILSGFGDKPGGLRNDGINIEAARGTAVTAAGDGTVAYAGNQLKSFGNLVLIRHDDGWVTVYAHLDEIKVQQGQQIARGQAVGTVGQTGNVRAPQLHFAVRKGEQVVNPLGQLEK